MKVLHIGGAHTRHTADVVAELNKKGVESVVISYFPEAQSICDAPVYHYPFKNMNNVVMFNQFIGLVMALHDKYRFHLAHVHSLDYSACAGIIVSQLLPTCISPWSMQTMIEGSAEKIAIETEAINKAKYVLINRPDLFIDFYKADKDKFVEWQYMVDFSNMERTRSRRILSARTLGCCYRQDLLLEAVKDIPITVVLGQHVSTQGLTYQKELKAIAGDNVTFIEKSLSVDEFKKLICEHDVMYAPATHDIGHGASILLGLYSGAEVIRQKMDDDLPCIGMDFTIEGARQAVDEAFKKSEMKEDLVENWKRSWIAEKFNKERMISILLDTYTRMVL